MAASVSSSAFTVSSGSLEEDGERADQEHAKHGGQHGVQLDVRFGRAGRYGGFLGD
jgi:hypothetical protein